MAGDVDALREDFTEDSVLLTPDGPVTGLDALREMFTGLTTELLPPGSELNLINQSIEGEVAYVVWSASSPKYNFPIGTDTFVIKNDKIVVQTFAAKIDPK
jgi:ketosteroid isomerase-like protein